MHPRNPHRTRYDFPGLIRCCPDLVRFVRRNPAGDDTIDFADPAAVTTLNQALLKSHYGVTHWSLPPGYLCPPIPGRADYIHQLADLLAGPAAIPLGPSVVVLDIGVGANCVYPIIGVHEYGWRFVGSEVDPVAAQWTERLIATNPALAGRVECRWQRSATAVFRGIVKPGETFAASLCNPPFHASPAEAAAGTRRKLRNLSGGRKVNPVLNFGGQPSELWCEGGESGFVCRMIAESAARPELCRWFTSLVSKRDSLPPILRALKTARAAEVRTIELAQGQKQSRIVAWRFRI